MVTEYEKPIQASGTTGLEQMPPLNVVTEGIPAAEHVEDIPAPSTEPPTVPPGEHRRIDFGWALAGVVGLLLLVGAIIGAAFLVSDGESELHMGLTQQVWQEFRAGERTA